MDYIDAVDFKGQFFGMKMRGPNDPDPKHFKKIRVEEPTEPVVKADPNVFHATGESVTNQKELLALAKAFASVNPDRLASDPDAAAAEKKSKVDLQAEVDALRAQLAAKSKPGPKPKERASV
jgi:hypothetical protein